MSLLGQRARPQHKLLHVLIWAVHAFLTFHVQAQSGVCTSTGNEGSLTARCIVNETQSWSQLGLNVSYVNMLFSGSEEHTHQLVLDTLGALQPGEHSKSLVHSA
jgi:hypothetical protein